MVDASKMKACDKSFTLIHLIAHATRDLCRMLIWSGHLRMTPTKSSLNPHSKCNSIPLFLMGWVDKVAPKLDKTVFNINVSIEIISIKWLQVLMSWQILFCQCPPKNSLTNISWNIPTAVPPPQLALRVREQTVQKMELNRGGKPVTVSNGYDAESLLMLLYIYICNRLGVKYH